jgi:hypothetical protein
MKYEDMSKFYINSKVAMRLGYSVSSEHECIKTGACFILTSLAGVRVEFNPCNNPSDAWPIIVENCISLTTIGDGNWHADTVESIDCTDSNCFTCVSSNHFHDSNPLRAAMICFLKMKDAEK